MTPEQIKKIYEARQQLSNAANKLTESLQPFFEQTQKENSEIVHRFFHTRLKEMGLSEKMTLSREILQLYHPPFQPFTPAKQ